METHDSHSAPETPTGAGEQWIRLCDDFVNLEGQCALLCELLAHLAHCDPPPDRAVKHGIDLFTSQFKHQVKAFKQQLYDAKLR